MPIRVSVSQIKKYMMCNRAWWYEYGPLKDKSPPTASTALGSKVHDILEKYLLEGTEPPENKAGRIASCGLDKLPDPEGLSIEESITIPLSENSKMLCRIDMLGTNSFYIGDHKTTSDFKWAKTRAELNNDVQLLSYAYAAYHEDKPEKVEGELIYYRTRGLPVSMSIKTVLDWEDIEKNWHSMGEIAEEMAPKKDDPDGESCPGNSGACSNFGGCYHAPKCPFSPQNRQIEKNNSTQVAKTDNNTPTAVAVIKEEGNKMDQKTIDIQKAFGILPPDVGPEVDQTPSLADAVTSDLKAMLRLFGGTVPGESVKNLFINKGLDEAEWPTVLQNAGATVDGQTVTTAAAVEKPVVEEKPTFQAQRKSFTDKDIRECANELREMVKASEGGISEDQIRAWFQGKMPPNRKVSETRWNRLVEYSELTLDGCWFHMPDQNGYTKEPEEKTLEPIPVPGITEEKRIENFAKGAPAIGGRFVVMVDALFSANTPSNALPFSVWVAPYMAAVEAKQESQGRDFYTLDADYAKGSKLLCSVLLAAFRQEEPVGLIVGDSGNAVFRSVLPVLERFGAVVIYGRR